MQFFSSDINYAAQPTQLLRASVGSKSVEFPLNDFDLAQVLAHFLSFSADSKGERKRT